MEVAERPTRHATDVRQAHLVAAALALAAQRSPADITTADLARVVGISQGAVFRHFASKQALWLAVLDWAASTLMARLDVAASAAHAVATPDQASDLAALRAVFMAHVDFVQHYPGVPRMIFQELQSPGDTAMKLRVRSLLARYRQMLMNLLQQAKHAGLLTPETDLSAAALLFIGSVQGLVMQALMSGDLAAATAHAPGVFAIYQRGLLATPTISKGTL
ncbi:TetR family transcriptional regulator [Rhodoferax sp.]|uniref:TetR/AcrR family transcriptional regulator n=1 Tax=Rhodoferax sp. TaxID=50421 RepID=UPI002633DF78|nr:TetR family transcriptional regulator [Rhodoferax sp.]MDD5479355.1 TetR family transcriptional regulator [Rhodoferax sp.]